MFFGLFAVCLKRLGNGLRRNRELRRTQGVSEVRSQQPAARTGPPSPLARAPSHPCTAELNHNHIQVVPPLSLFVSRIVPVHKVLRSRQTLRNWTSALLCSSNS